MSKLEIRSIDSPDVAVDSWMPAAKEDVYFVIELEIGEKGVPGADLFQLVVATAEGLRRVGRGASDPPAPGTLVIDEFSWSRVHRFIVETVRHCDTDEWTSSVQRLQEHFLWEYADYSQEE